MKIIVEEKGTYERYKKAVELMKEYEEIRDKMNDFEQKLNDFMFDFVEGEK